MRKVIYLIQRPLNSCQHSIYGYVDALQEAIQICDEMNGKENLNDKSYCECWCYTEVTNVPKVHYLRKESKIQADSFKNIPITEGALLDEAKLW